MSKSIKAALLSALIFPGVGQISAGHKKRGWIIIAAHGVLLYFIFNELMQQANSVIAKMQQSGSAMDIEAITNASARLTEFSDNSLLNVLIVLLLAGWIFSAIDAYRYGKKETK